MVSWLTGPWVIDGIAGAVLLMGLALVVWGLGLRRFRDRRVPKCPKCGYDLRGNSPERARKCPECGHTAKSDRELLRGRTRRRWWAVALGLIVFVLPSTGALYVVIGWQREQAAVAALDTRHPNGRGTAMGSVYSFRLEWVGPKWLLPHVPAGLQCYGQRVIGLDATGRFDDADMAQLGDLTNLRQLFLDDTLVTEAGLAHVSGLTEMTVLNIFRGQQSQMQVTDREVVYFSRLTKLVNLSLYGIGITDAGLAHLSGLTNLTDLDLSYNRVTDAGMVHLSKLTKLRTLGLNGTQVTDAGLVHLAGLKELTELWLNETRVGDAGLTHLSGLSNLTRLELESAPLSGVRLSHLAGLTKLTQIRLSHTKVTDAGLEHLAKVSNLSDLRLDYTVITDAGLAHLSGLRNLADLNLSGTQVTAAGVAALQKAIPGIQIIR